MADTPYYQIGNSWRRLRRGCLITVVSLSVLIAAVSIYFGGCFYIATASDADEANRLVEALVREHPTLAGKGGSTLFCTPRSRYISLELHDDYTRQERNTICDLVIKVRQKLGARAVRVTFYKEGEEIQDDVFD